MLVGHGMIADLVSLRLDPAPIVQTGGLGNDEEESGAQMALIEFRNRNVQMHGARVVKGKRQRGRMIVPRQNLERGCLRRAAARQQTSRSRSVWTNIVIVRLKNFHAYTMQPRCQRGERTPSE